MFDIAYGFYDVRTAQLQERLRSVLSKLRQLTSQAELFASFFEDTALENRAALEHELSAVRRELSKAEAEAVDLAARAGQPSRIAELQARVLQLQADVEKLRSGIAAEATSAVNLRALVGQLESQSARLTRSIVSGSHLTDIDFVVCPRCGSEVEPDRVPNDELCYLCFQMPSLDFSRDVLIKEQDAVDAQLVESQDLIGEREERLNLSREALRELEDELAKVTAELDFQTRAYVSEHADRIATFAAQRSALKARERQLEEYIEVLRKLDESHRQRADLAVERDQLETELAVASGETTNAAKHVAKLEARYNEILERFQPPAFGEELLSSIDRTTYLPIYHGRRFDNLSSPGLATLVNVAHALAHHVTTIECELPLPNLLIIDGLSEHLGQEGLDPERLLAVYEYLMELSDKLGEQLQVIVVDNEVPDAAREFIRLELSETDRLIPENALSEEPAALNGDE